MVFETPVKNVSSRIKYDTDYLRRALPAKPRRSRSWSLPTHNLALYTVSTVSLLLLRFLRSPAVRRSLSLYSDRSSVFHGGYRVLSSVRTTVRTKPRRISRRYRIHGARAGGFSLFNAHDQKSLGRAKRIPATAGRHERPGEARQSQVSSDDTRNFIVQITLYFTTNTCTRRASRIVYNIIIVRVQRYFLWVSIWQKESAARDTACTCAGPPATRRSCAFETTLRKTRAPPYTRAAYNTITIRDIRLL